MTAVQVKSTLKTWANDIAGIWFSPDTFAGKMLLPAIQEAIEINVEKLEPLLSIYTDVEGNISVDKLIERYIKVVPEEGLTLRASDFLGDNFLTRSISAKILERSDLVKLKNLLTNGN